MKITIEQVMATEPCYTEDQVLGLLPDGHVEGIDAALEVLLSIPENDGRWIVSRLLSVTNKVVWAEECAKRAKGYAAEYACAASASAASAAVRYASASAASGLSMLLLAEHAVDAAEHAAEYASDAAADAVAQEHGRAMRHGLELLG